MPQSDITRHDNDEKARATVVEHRGGYGAGLAYARDMINPA